MMILGVTGSIGMGKSTVTKMLHKNGVAVFDSDQAVASLLGPFGKAVPRVVESFPEAAIPRENKIDKKILRQSLGNDHAAWDDLEGILHPHVFAMQKEFLKKERARGREFAALDIPLLFETGAEHKVDHTILVTAPPWIQWQRIQRRGGIDVDDFLFRLSRQMPDVEKRRRADFIIRNGLGLGYTYRQVQAVLKYLRQGKKSRTHHYA